MTISARNIFKGKVTAIKKGPINAEVEITAAGGDVIVAMLTETSVRSLGLAIGKDAAAVIKASWVTLVAGTPEYRFSARNQMKGMINGLIRGAAFCEVKVALPGGETMCAMVTKEAAEELGLGEGTAVVAMFKAGHVLVGVKE